MRGIKIQGRFRINKNNISKGDTFMKTIAFELDCADAQGFMFAYLLIRNQRKHSKDDMGNKRMKILEMNMFRMVP